MNIVIFVSYTYPYIGSGIGNVALKQAEELVNFGNSVTVVSSNYPRTKNQFVKNGVKHVKLKSVRFLEKIHVPIPIYIFNTNVTGLIRSADIIHVHDAVYPSSFLATIIAKIFNKPVILTQHIPFIKYPNFLINLIQRMAYETVGRITFLLSNKIVIIDPEIKKIINVRQKSIHLIPNGVDVSFFRPVNIKRKYLLRKKYNLPQNTKIVLFVGRFVPKKGYKLLFQARDNKYLLLFVGGGKVPTEMQNEKYVIILSQKEQNELKEIYQLSDVFILPSHSEGFPLSIQEAMASGLPIITSKQNLIDKPFSFIKTTDLNPTDIKKSIIELLHNNTLTKNMKYNSRKYAVENYSWDSNIKETIKTYQEALT